MDNSIPADARLTRAALVIRGLLAEPSGHPDDPFRRVLLAVEPEGRAAPAPAGLPLRLEAPPEGLASAALRQALQPAFDAYRARHGAAPAAVEWPGVGTFVARRPAADAAAPLAGKVALVTGAAGAIGAGICKGLLRQGCCVAAADIAPQNLETLCRDLEALGPGRVRGARMDVTDAASVAAGFGEAVRAWGGVDLVVINAGIAMVASLLDMDPAAFAKLERVNVEGTLLTLQEAGRCLCAQGTGGDIVLISTKNVFAPGASFGAYSATKAASHQLARIASLEFAPHDIRVNMVAPDAVFGDAARPSGLWAEVGPSRMRARGLDEKGLEEYYRSRNLLKARVTPEHVANAVLFFATRQTPTTGATLPVDGGLPDSTPR